TVAAAAPAPGAGEDACVSETVGRGVWQPDSASVAARRAGAIDRRVSCMAIPCVPSGENGDDAPCMPHAGPASSEIGESVQAALRGIPAKRSPVVIGGKRLY